MPAKKRRKLPLYVKILLGMILGVSWGLVVSGIEGGSEFTQDFIRPI
jgi:Na+/H+-dicarboxylate symporter